MSKKKNRNRKPKQAKQANRANQPKTSSESNASESVEPGSAGESHRVARKRDFKVFYIALVSFAMLWFSFPPIGWGWLAWFALIPLMWLVQVPRLPQKSLRQIWFAGFLYFLATLYFLPLPFWALWFGWALLAFYLSLYVPLFLVAARTLRHRFGIPTLFAAPIAWCGLEWVRGTFATGFGMAFLSHTQYRYPLLIQIADTFGAYGISFAIVMFAVGLSVATLPKRLPRFWMDYEPDSFSDRDGKATIFEVTRAIRIVHVICSVLILAGVAGYSLACFDAAPKTSGPKIKIALIQSSLDTDLKPLTKEEYRERSKFQFEHRRKLTLEARQKWPDLDLIIWPESSIEYYDLLSDYDAEITVEKSQQNFRMGWLDSTMDPVQNISAPIPLLAGTTTEDSKKKLIYNSAVLLNTQGLVTDRYFKIHRVMFGEYFPILESIPYAKDLVKGFRALSPGTEFKNFSIKQTNIAPNICFESTVPHFIRRQVNTLSSQGNEPEILVNITNDGWFFGTSCLDLHLACNVFRAVEMRKTHLVCGNTGLSAHIGEMGDIKEVGLRRQPDLLRCDVSPGNLDCSRYRSWGAWTPSIFGFVSLAAILLTLFKSDRPPNFRGKKNK